MCLIICAFAAVIATLLWYFVGQNRKYKLGFLALMYWGASIMWFVDGIYEVASGGTFLGIVQPLEGEASGVALEALHGIVSDDILGFVVVLCGLLLWLVVFLVSDPKGVFASLKKPASDKNIENKAK
jgi:hypothetical protein